MDGNEHPSPLTTEQPDPESSSKALIENALDSIRASDLEAAKIQVIAKEEMRALTLRDTEQKRALVIRKFKRTGKQIVEAPFNVTAAAILFGADTIEGLAEGFFWGFAGALLLTVASSPFIAPALCTEISLGIIQISALGGAIARIPHAAKEAKRCLLNGPNGP
ncbi:MAG: hypothetical protein PHE27_03955 [Alphaproteobacteria bacterium]|nr:hypothetical protein [Alphaproteobacteria bacterium]